MKRPNAIFLIFICVFLVFAGKAFAETAPSAMSYFTNPDYNKAYTDEEGLSHTMSVKWVGETHNKLGTVIYSINYEDIYQKDSNIYIDAMSATEIYENARPLYPDSSKHIVYQVKWYADGSKEIISDSRPAVMKKTQHPPQNMGTSKAKWIWLVVVFAGIGIVIPLAFWKWRKEKKNHGKPKA